MTLKQLMATIALVMVMWGAVGVNAGPPPGPLPIDTSKPGQTFHGLGGLSGGGATTRLLIDYPEEQRNQVLSPLAAFVLSLLVVLR